jgi:hypothetical protein
MGRTGPGADDWTSSRDTQTGGRGGQYPLYLFRTRLVPEQYGLEYSGPLRWPAWLTADEPGVLFPQS